MSTTARVLVLLFLALVIAWQDLVIHSQQKIITAQAERLENYER